MSTKTRSFGSSARESHDASRFYGRKLYQGQREYECAEEEINAISPQFLNAIYHRDARNLDFLPANSVHLMITSPPYTVGKDYEDDLSQDDYLTLIHDVMKEIYRVLVPGGRACINVANVGRKPYLPLNQMINGIMLDLGFLMRGEIIWDKGASAGGSCAWGSWRSASNPVLRDVHEYILVYSKLSFGRREKGKKQSTIGRDEFLEYTKSIWTFGAESAKKVNHPAPFPLELPSRLIQLYSYADDVVIDPFCGSGTTCVAALQSGRYFLGVDIDETYVKSATERVFAHQQAESR